MQTSFFNSSLIYLQSQSKVLLLINFSEVVQSRLLPVFYYPKTIVVHNYFFYMFSFSINTNRHKLVKYLCFEREHYDVKVFQNKHKNNKHNIKQNQMMKTGFLICYYSILIFVHVFTINYKKHILNSKNI